jgi:hypothetical protein
MVNSASDPFEKGPIIEHEPINESQNSKDPKGKSNLIAKIYSYINQLEIIFVNIISNVGIHKKLTLSAAAIVVFVALIALFVFIPPDLKNFTFSNFFKRDTEEIISLTKQINTINQKLDTEVSKRDFLEKQLAEINAKLDGLLEERPRFKNLEENFLILKQSISEIGSSTLKQTNEENLNSAKVAIDQLRSEIEILKSEIAKSKIQNRNNDISEQKLIESLSKILNSRKHSNSKNLVSSGHNWPDWVLSKLSQLYTIKNKQDLVYEELEIKVRNGQLDPAAKQIKENIAVLPEFSDWLSAYEDHNKWKEGQ